MTTMPVAPPPRATSTHKVLSTTELAKIYHRTSRCIQLWCVNGTLVEFGFQIQQDAKKRWWILVPYSILNNKI